MRWYPAEEARHEADHIREVEAAGRRREGDRPRPADDVPFVARRAGAQPHSSARNGECSHERQGGRGHGERDAAKHKDDHRIERHPLPRFEYEKRSLNPVGE